MQIFETRGEKHGTTELQEVVFLSNSTLRIVLQLFSKYQFFYQFGRINCVVMSLEYR